eukprot:6751249-Pyramimonas_sp.AAC.1
MDWCVEYVSDVLRYCGFRDLLRCPVGAASGQAVRWEVATEICLRGWYAAPSPWRLCVLALLNSGLHATT